MSRKTVAVEDVKSTVNGMLQKSDDNNQDGRVALIVLVEKVLMDTDNYKGFQYLASEYLPSEEQTFDKVLRDNYDDTRRRYF